MARITPDAESTATTNNTERAEKITDGVKICAMLGFFYENHNGNKKLQIGYAVINDDPRGEKPEGSLSENGLIHIDTLLIRDSVMWKHQKWSGGCGFSEGYDNEDQDDIMKIILSCPAVQCTFQTRSYEWRGETRTSLEIKDWKKVDENKYITNGIEKLISSCEQGFDKIVQYRVQRGDDIQRPRKQAVYSDPNDDFDQYVSGGNNDDGGEILF